MTQVLKFGGSSVANATNISRVLDIVTDSIRRGRVILVSSAIRGCTDRLIEIGRMTDPERKGEAIGALRAQHHDIIRRLFTGAERAECAEEVDVLFDALASAAPDETQTYGELFSTKIIARKLACDGVRARWIDAREIIRVRDGKVDTAATYAAVAAAVRDAGDAEVLVAPGFVARDARGKVTDLGRGGSDYSAALFAAGCAADALEIWTDVPGIMTTNPKDVAQARTIPSISYQAALDMAVHGAKVLYAPTVAPAMEAGIAIHIRNTFDPQHPGTVIGNDEKEPVGEWMGLAGEADPERGETRLCLVGERITDPAPAAERIRSVLTEAGIAPVREIAAEGNLIFTDVRTLVAREAIRAIHREFFEESALSVIDIFIAGHGAVGKALVGLIARNGERLARSANKAIRIVGLSDSRRYVIDLQGIAPADAAARLVAGRSAAGGAFVDAVEACAPRRSVFVDCTNDHDLYLRYDGLLRRGVNIVTSNRRSLAVPYVRYAGMKAAARQNGSFFRYDTTVGNALPILESIATGATGSDEIVAIEAVVSCTLNHIITGYDGVRTESFATLLRRAQDAGLTERDPRTDLGGRDALRKLLILAREAGIPLEEEDVEITPMLGPEFFDCDLDEFYVRLRGIERAFQAREDELDALGKRQRFVASVRKDPAARLGYRAEIKMQLVDIDNPFYWVKGTENVTIIRSEYAAPLVIKGAGEGARLAATGIIKDILMH